MTKKLLIITGYAIFTAAMISCGARRSPGRAYMPDMTYSRAYETYAPAQERLDQSGTDIHPQYNAKPVDGTIARGDMLAYSIKKADSALSNAVKNPLDVSKVDLKEAERLYLVNCGICHGTKLDGNGPLFASGAYAAAPKDLMATTYSDGKLFHTITFGQGQMGSYASQLTTAQRWMIVSYIRNKHTAGAAKPAGADSTGAKTATVPASVDSAGVKKG